MFVLPCVLRSVVLRPRSVATVAAIASGALLLAACSTTADATEPDGAAASTDSAPAILYSVDAPQPSLVADGEDLRLTLPADAPVAWFTDRPDRSAGSIDLRELVAIWEASGFVDDPPNAALTFEDGATELTHVVELLDPQSADGRVSFRLRTIPDGVEAGHAHVHDLAVGTYDRALLFIDDAAVSPCPSSIPSGPAGLKTTPKATTPSTVLTCLLAPGAKVTVSQQASTLETVVWGCFTNSDAQDGTYTATVDTTLRALYRCVPQIGFGNDAWLATTGGPAACNTTGRTMTVSYPATSPQPMRLSVTTEQPVCVTVKTP